MHTPSFQMTCMIQEAREMNFQEVGQNAKLEGRQYKQFVAPQTQNIIWLLLTDHPEFAVMELVFYAYEYDDHYTAEA